MKKEIKTFDEAYNALKEKAIEILIKAHKEKGIDRINLDDHNMQCRVLLADRYDYVVSHDVISIRIVDTPQPNTILLETDNGWGYLNHCEAWSEIDLFKEIIAYEDEIMNLVFI